MLLRESELKSSACTAIARPLAYMCVCPSLTPRAFLFKVFVLSAFCLLSAGPLPPYAVRYQAQGHVLPWKALMVDGYDNAPWVLHLPPEANWSLHGLGRYFLSQTPVYKRGRVSMDQYGPWVWEPETWHEHSSAAEVLIKCCAAFAHSPLSVIVDIRAAVECIYSAARRLAGTDQGKWVVPVVVEQELDYVCAAGCGKDLSKQGSSYISDYGDSLLYCSTECAQVCVGEFSHPCRTWTDDGCLVLHALLSHCPSSCKISCFLALCSCHVI